MDRGSLDVVRMQVDVRWTSEWNECTLAALLMCSYPCLDRTSRKWSTEFEWPEGFSMLFRAGEGCRSYTRYGKDQPQMFCVVVLTSTTEMVLFSFILHIITGFGLEERDFFCNHKTVGCTLWKWGFHRLEQVTGDLRNGTLKPPRGCDWMWSSLPGFHNNSLCLWSHNAENKTGLGAACRDVHVHRLGLCFVNLSRT